MSLTSILNAGLSGLQASQTGMRVASQNIANANTLGYVRTEISLAPLTNLGNGLGVEVSSVKRAADKFLATAAYIAEANAGAAQARSDLLARAQGYFGDPNSASSLFSTIDAIWSAMTQLQVDPSSTLSRDSTVRSIESAFALIGQTADAVQALIAEADERIGDAVSQAQSYMDRIAALNDEIRLTKNAGADATNVENAQSALIDQLSRLFDIRVETNVEGGVSVRTAGGALLVGAQAAQLAYTPSGSSFATHNVITFNAQLGTNSNLEPYITGGEIAGLLQARDRDLPSIAEALGGYAAALADKLNLVHNENSSTPAVDHLTGRQTGLLASDGLNFTGSAIVGLTDAAGLLTQRLTIDFDTGVITGEAPAATYNFTNSIASFTAALNSAMGAATPAGSASFTNGVLSLDINAGGGIVVQQASGDPSNRAGRGFSHFFGLNDIVERPTPFFFEAGVTGADLLGLNAGGEISFLVRDSSGRYTAERTVSISGALAAPGATMADLVNALNATGTGVGEYATFAIDAQGRLTMTPRPGFSPVIVNDSTQRGGTGVSLSSLFGLSSAATAGRAFETGVSAEIASDPGLLAVARPNLAATIGTRVIEAGDSRGIAALAAVRDTSFSFAAAGALTAQTTTLGLYASRLGGVAGRLASDADQAAKGAAAVSAAAADRRAQVEGVTVDEELLRMTTYQNSYAAAARIIQAATDMFDILLSIGAR